MKAYILALLTSCFAPSTGLVGSALAQQDYPNKPIRLIVPYAPGGSTTFTSRLVGQRFTEAWGQQVIIDNRPGANTIIGTHLAVKSRPDGYTLLYIGSALAGNHTLTKTPYDAISDIAPVASISSYEYLLVVTRSLPVTTPQEFIALAEARPGQLNFATSSSGGSTHMAPELFNSVAGIKTQQIPYKGGGPAITDLVGGQVQFMMSPPINVVGQVKNGRLRAIAISGESRIAVLPQVPTIAEAGIPGVLLTSWQGVGAPEAHQRRYSTSCLPKSRNWWLRRRRMKSWKSRVSCPIITTRIKRRHWLKRTFSNTSGLSRTPISSRSSSP